MIFLLQESLNPLFDVLIPVEIPQLRAQTLSRGAKGLILARQPTWTTVYSLKVDVPTKW